ncbi:LysR family transcriptional regulator [Acetobacter musti]|uniref:LysR family transcriptional regulator n=1 Tax=Acetobacter musti TaxID=864732 RepID=A0ABX0JQ93_9PROT|nr:LysR family transcriptional regulator [Acetobacter musti]NHN85628.1 LysR family transcriptional regulator [Acetobacter musti]
MPRDHDLDPQLLRSFLAVADTLHFTTAAHARGVSQSTISQHISKLEKFLDRSLLVRSTRDTRLTEDGQLLVPHAKQILAACDAAFDEFEPDFLSGHIRFGVSDDLVLSHLPEVLREFRTMYPSVHVSLVVGLSSELNRRLHSGELDVACTKRFLPSSEVFEGECVLWREQLRWLGARGLSLPETGPVPLVAYEKEGLNRRRSIEALNHAGLAWQLSFVSDHLSALIAGVRAGYGVFMQSSLLTDDSIVPVETPVLPPLPEMEFLLVPGRSTRAVKALMRTLMENVSRVAPRGSEIPAALIPVQRATA